MTVFLFVCACVCVTCRIAVLCIQADTDRTATALLHPGGRWDWNFCSVDDVVVVEVVDEFGSVVQVWGAAGGWGGRREDRGELRPLFVSSKHLCPYFHFLIIAFALFQKHTLNLLSLSLYLSTPTRPYFHTHSWIWKILSLPMNCKPKWTERATNRQSKAIFSFPWFCHPPTSINYR